MSLRARRRRQDRALRQPRRLDVARGILGTFAPFIEGGLLPNRFPEGKGGVPEYGTIDAALVMEEALLHRDALVLRAVLDRQPAWSDLPILVVSASGSDSPVAQWAERGLRNVTLLPSDDELAAVDVEVDAVEHDAAVERPSNP